MRSAKTNGLLKATGIMVAGLPCHGDTWDGALWAADLDTGHKRIIDTAYDLPERGIALVYDYGTHGALGGWIREAVPGHAFMLYMKNGLALTIIGTGKGISSAFHAGFVDGDADVAVGISLARLAVWIHRYLGASPANPYKGALPDVLAVFPDDESAAEWTERAFELAEPTEEPPAPARYKCASPTCPGLPWKASDHPHPVNCGADPA